MKSATDRLKTYEDIEHTIKKSPRQIKVPAHIYSKQNSTGISDKIYCQSFLNYF